MTGDLVKALLVEMNQEAVGVFLTQRYREHRVSQRILTNPDSKYFNS